MRRGLRAAFVASFVSLPAALSLLSVGFERGLDVDALAAVQGPLPWQWTALSNPGFGLAFLLLLATALPDPLPRRGLLSHADTPLSLRGVLPVGPLEQLRVCSLCAIAVPTFLGGDALPELLSGTGGTSLEPAVCAVVLLIKYLAVALSVLALRAACAPPTAAQWSGVTARVLLPLSLAAGLCAHFWPLLAQGGPLLAWIEAGFGPVAAAALVGLLAAVVAWQWRTPDPSGAEGGLSPWL
jgi:hypothetical protein